MKSVERSAREAGKLVAAVGRASRGALAFALLAPAMALAVAAGTDAVAAQAAATAQRAPQPTIESALDRRMALLTAELQLSPAQQVQVRDALEHQREEVRQLWRDSSVPAAVRISRTQAVSGRTAEAIRAVLDDQQRRKYTRPRQHDAAVGAGGAGIEAWTPPGGGR